MRLSKGLVWSVVKQIHRERVEVTGAKEGDSRIADWISSREPGLGSSLDIRGGEGVGRESSPGGVRSEGTAREPRHENRQLPTMPRDIRLG